MFWESNWIKSLREIKATLNDAIQEEKRAREE